jgi:hypothetical protein
VKKPWVDHSVQDEDIDSAVHARLENEPIPLQAVIAEEYHLATKA